MSYITGNEKFDKETESDIFKMFLIFLVIIILTIITFIIIDKNIKPHVIDNVKSVVHQEKTVIFTV